MPALPKRLAFMALDDAENFGNSIETLIGELPLFDELEEIFQDFQNRDRKMVAGETKYYALCHLSRLSIIKACMAMMRLHVGDAFTLSRQSADAAFYAVMMSAGRMSEEEYQGDWKVRNSLQGVIRREIAAKGLPPDLPSIVIALQKVFYDHSKHAHADPIALANRLIEHPDGGIQFSFHQRVDDDRDFQYFFMGMIWVGGMCLKAFLEIQAKLYGEEVHQFVDRIEALKARLFARRQAIGVHPDHGPEHGF